MRAHVRNAVELSRQFDGAEYLAGWLISLDEAEREYFLPLTMPLLTTEEISGVLAHQEADYPAEAAGMRMDFIAAPGALTTEGV
jgi:hypothetical protein